jgi:arylsulfatase A-like enzyme
MPTLSRRDFLATTAAGASAALIGCGKKHPPNVVFILTDDHRWDCLSCAGHPYLKTPNMDRLAAEGVRFANAFCTASLCSPSRASFLSGNYAHTHGVRNNFTEYPDAMPSYPKALQAAGYHTGYIGKWHMGENNDAPRAGFDYWASHKGQGQYYDTEFNINGTRQVMKGYYTDTVTNLAVDWIRTARRPFAIEVGHKAPHGLWIPEPKYAKALDHVVIKKPATAVPGPGTPEWVKRRMKTWHGIDGPLYGAKDYDTFVRTYLETILSVDDGVGAVYETLRSIGELDNTVFVFAGDQGFLLGEHASIDKRTAWEESIRLPLLVRYPEVAKTPRVVNELVLNMDLAPSLIDLAGAGR